MVLSLFLFVIALIANIQGIFNINNLKSELLLRNFINLRTGNKCNKNGIWWHYKGIIRNPLSGKEIIAIEGVENIRLIDASWFPLKKIRNNIFKKSNDNNHYNNNESTVKDSDVYGRYICNKVFIYTQLDNRTSPVTEYRLHPSAPTRVVQPIKHYMEDITVSKQLKQQNQQKQQNQIQKMGNSNSNPKMSIEIKWPGGRTLVTNQAEFLLPSCLGNTGGIGLAGRRQLELSCFLRSESAREREKKRKINKWISFAPGPKSSTPRSSESYMLTRNSVFTTPTMICRRQGECPSWYAPGRQCSSEITAKRYNSYRALPKQARQLVSIYPDVVNSLRSPESLTTSYFNSETVSDPLLVMKKSGFKWIPKALTNIRHPSSSSASSSFKTNDKDDNKDK